MIAFLLGVTTTIIVFILILYHLNQYSTDSEFRAQLDEKNIFNLKQNPENGQFETFKREITLTNETVEWINLLFSQIFTHFRGDSKICDINLLNEAITDALPPGFSFKLDTIGKDIIFDQPKLYYIQESNSNPTISNSNEDKEILQVNIPFKYNGLSFTIFSQIDGKDDKNQPLKIPLFEFDFRRIEASICMMFTFESQNKTEDIESKHDFTLSTSFQLEKEPNILDFDASLIMNKKKITFTNYPIFGDFIKTLLQYFIIRRKFNFLINSSMINYDAFHNFIEKQKIIQTEVNLI